MSINELKQDGHLFWTELHRAARLNEVPIARQLLEMGADPNLRVKVCPEPLGQCHGHYDDWWQSQGYAGRTCLDLAVDMWDQGRCYEEMRALLRSYGGKSSRKSVDCS